MSRAAAHALSRMAVEAGASVRTTRLGRRWTLRELGDHAGISPARVQRLKAGEPASLEVYARVMVALGLRPTLVAGAASGRPPRPTQDLVHAAMGELEAGRLRRQGVSVALDEPYQHFQFAGRADLVAWDLDRRVLLHLENRTQFPNIQETLGSYGAKRAYLPRVLADRLGLAKGWRHVTNAIVALWSAEVVHVLRMRPATFRSACPDPPNDVLGWWSGDLERLGPRVTSSFVLMDPADVHERFRFASLDAALTARPRYRDYAAAATALERRTPRESKRPREPDH